MACRRGPTAAASSLHDNGRLSDLILTGRCGPERDDEYQVQDKERDGNVIAEDGRARIAEALVGGPEQKGGGKQRSLEPIAQDRALFRLVGNACQGGHRQGEGAQQGVSL